MMIRSFTLALAAVAMLLLPVAMPVHAASIRSSPYLYTCVPQETGPLKFRVTCEVQGGIASMTVTGASSFWFNVSGAPAKFFVGKTSVRNCKPDYRFGFLVGNCPGDSL